MQPKKPEELEVNTWIIQDDYDLAGTSGSYLKTWNTFHQQKRLVLTYLFWLPMTIQLDIRPEENLH